MRLLILGLIASVAAGCSNNHGNDNAATNVNGPEMAAPPLYKNIPGAVTGNRAAGINSTFRIVQAAQIILQEEVRLLDEGKQDL